MRENLIDLLVKTLLLCVIVGAAQGLLSYLDKHYTGRRRGRFESVSKILWTFARVATAIVVIAAIVLCVCVAIDLVRG
jgi:hypothetical protein